MKKKVILLAIVLIILAPFFIPVTQQKTVLINARFLKLYTLLLAPDKWEKWRPDVRKLIEKDSTKLSVQKDTNAFTIKYADLTLEVKQYDGSFYVNDHFGDKTASYNYFALPDSTQTKTYVTVYKKTNVVSYLIEQFGQVSFADTHIDELKNFMETDSLRYGFRIFKTRVPQANLIVMRKEVSVKDKFTEAEQMFSSLQQYVKIHNLKQMQPVIAQYLPKGTDSTQVNVGFFIDKEVKSDKDITFTRMPKGGPLYSAKFNGKFDERQKAYNGIQQYFTDHVYQSAILPFETYLDNKLPTSDTDRVNIMVNFTTYF